MRWELVTGAGRRDEAGCVATPVVIPAVLGPGRPPETVELTGATAELGPGRTLVWLACAAVTLGMVAGLGFAGRLETGVRSGAQPAGNSAGASGGAVSLSLAAGSDVVPPATRGPGAASRSASAAPQQIVILLPGPGEVILGHLVPVAGRAVGQGPPRGATPLTLVHVAIASENTNVGEAELPVVAGRFAGWVEVTAPMRGRVVEIRAWDPLHSDGAATIQSFVLRGLGGGATQAHSLAGDSAATRRQPARQPGRMRRTRWGGRGRRAAFRTQTRPASPRTPAQRPCRN